MSEVWMFPLDIADDQKLTMPQDAELLYVGEQHGKVMLWARVIASGQRMVQREIIMRGTGQPIWTQPYVGSVITLGGELVWHVFDGGEEDA